VPAVRSDKATNCVPCVPDDLKQLHGHWLNPAPNVSIFAADAPLEHRASTPSAVGR